MRQKKNIKGYPLNEKVRSRRERAVSHYQLREMEIKEALAEQKKARQIKKVNIPKQIMVSNNPKLWLAYKSHKLANKGNKGRVRNIKTK